MWIVYLSIYEISAEINQSKPKYFTSLNIILFFKL